MSDLLSIRVTINGRPKSVDVAPDEKLLQMLRRIGLTGVKHGCSEGVCGACTVILDGRAICSCLLFAWQADGRTIQTIEGVGSFDAPHSIQQALVEEGAVQCGYCTPGMILSAKALLDENPDATWEDMNEHLDGNLCRCTGYEKIEAALRRVLNARGGEEARHG
jgi:carbon-monoxide dehydrogenase small subunit